jgi:hypothetical protein
MAGPIGQARGQAMIELMVMATLVLVLVSAGVALSGTIMKMFKHNFLAPSSKDDIPQDDLVNSPELKKYIRFFPHLSQRESLNQLKSEGYSIEQKFSVPQGLILLLKKENSHLALIENAEGRLAVYDQTH